MFSRRTKLSAACDQCKKRFRIESNMEDRPHPGRLGVTEYGLLCPHCGFFVHSYYITKPLQQMQKRLQEAQEQARLLKSAQKRAERLRAEFQIEWEKLNPPEVAEEA
jgi:C4-type Zn-finger protein